jgi:hypothetical protein
VLPPHKTFRGPVGAFQRIGYDLDRYFYLYQSLCSLRTEAFEKHYLGEDSPHADESGHQCDAYVPLELAAEINTQDERIERKYMQGRDNAIELMRKSWGVLGSEQRRVAEHAFLSQLEHDPLYTCSRPARQTILWNAYKGIMNDDEYFD